MITDLRAAQGMSAINASIVIVGAGAAGITLALELQNRFKEIVVLESGGLDFEPETQELYEGQILGREALDLASSRLRFFGGTTNHWQGFCSPLDEIDFEPDPARNHLGWPMGFETLKPYYARACRYCEIGAFRERSAFTAAHGEKASQIAEAPDLELAEFRYSPPTRFGERYRHDLESSGRVRVLLHANVTGIEISPNGEAVKSLTVRALGGPEVQVTASTYILCCGAIENARILLNSTGFFRFGIGNQYDLVGRYFMDHLNATGGEIVPANNSFELGSFLLRGALDGNVQFNAVYRNTAEAIRTFGRQSCSIFLSPTFEKAGEIQKAKSASSYEAIRDIVRDLKSAKFPDDLEARGCTAVSDPASLLSAIYYRATEAAGVLSTIDTIAVQLTGEQSPNPLSRVVLTSEVDALGMRRAGLDWHVRPQDYNSMRETALSLARGIGAKGFGRMRVTGLDDGNVHSASHQMGTTRMDDDPRRGVVDGHSRVHGLENFYIAGSSVFPSAGRVNPTLTIVALAIRLADRLVEKVH